MNLKAETNYWTASAFSFAAHKDRTEIPLQQEGILEIPLGFQPYGINSRPLSGGSDAVVLADYFAPAVCTFEVRIANGILRLEKVAWIHGAQNGITRCRGGFPDIAQPTGANRCVAVCLDPYEDGSVWVNRGEREFFVLSPVTVGTMTAQEQKTGVRWELRRRVLLPQKDEFPSVYSATFSGRVLHTIESNNRLDSYEVAQYEVAGDTVTARVRESTLARSGGIARTSTGGFLTVTNAEVANREKGIYLGSNLYVPGVSGTGICALSNGGALVSRYGQEAGGPFKGIPGALLYIPPSLLPLAGSRRVR